MSKTVFNPYRDMLDIPSLTDENPTDYQLLGIDDFEDDSDKIAAAHEKRAARIAELYQIVTKMSQKIDEARDRISDSAKKEEYDDYLRRTGRAGVPHLGKAGSLAVLGSFVFSIIVVIVSTFYIYPMVVAIPPENIGDSVSTLPSYNETQTQKEIDILKKRQEDVTTMDVNFNLPIDLDADTTVDFVDESGMTFSGEETTLDNPPQEDAPLTLVDPSDAEPSAPLEDTVIEEPTETSEPEETTELTETSEPVTPVVPEQTEEEPVLPDVPDVPEPIDEQTPIEDAAADQTPTEMPEPETPEPKLPEPEPATPDVPQQTEAAPVVPELPAVPESIVEPAPILEDAAVDQTVTAPPQLIAPPLEDSSVLTPDDSADLAVLDPPSNPDVHFDSDTPRVPKISSFENPGIPELPPLEEAPDPPTIPELSIVSDTPTTNVVLEDVDKVEYFVQLGQKARTDADFAQLLLYASQAEDDLMKERAFSKAQQIADVVYESCARIADKTYRSEAFRQKEFVAKRSRLWEYVSAAEAKMASEGTVSSSEANIVARWKIEIENDWQSGLKYLILSDNEQVRNAARNELAANPEDVRSVLTVANSWWNLSQDPIPMQQRFRERACTWYAKALPFISDKQIRILVEKRISMSEAGYPKR